MERIQGAAKFVSTKLGSRRASTTRARRFSDADRTAGALDRLTISGDGSSKKEKTETSQLNPLEQHRCSSKECAVTTMFETTELLEIVLDFLDTESVLNLQRVSKHWNETVHSSPTLRLHHFVRPRWSRPAADFQLLDFKIPGLSIEPGDDIEMGKWIQVSMTNAAARRISPEGPFAGRVRSRSIFEGMRGGLGRRARRTSSDTSDGPSSDEDSWPARPKPKRDHHVLKYGLLHVMQPPVLGVQAYIIDPTPFAGPSQPDQSPPREPALCAKLHCDSGITLGFLAETTQSLLLDCTPSAAPDARIVVFKAIVSFTTPNGTPRRRGNTRSVTRLC